MLRILKRCNNIYVTYTSISARLAKINLDYFSKVNAHAHIFIYDQNYVVL